MRYTVWMRVSAAERTRAANPFLVIALSWVIPGLGHLLLGRWRKGLVFVIALPVMFFIGLALEGRIFPFQASDILVTLAALADLGIGLIYFLAGPFGWGAGKVTAVTYEYGNAFLIVAGLLNLLVVLDAYDVARGRK